MQPKLAVKNEFDMDKMYGAQIEKVTFLVLCVPGVVFYSGHAPRRDAWWSRIYLTAYLSFSISPMHLL